MTNNEIILAACRTAESDPVYMSLVTRYDNDPDSLTPAELSMMLDLADAAMPSFEEWSLLTELGFIDDD